MQLPDKLFQGSGDGIYSSSIAYLFTNYRSCKEFMTYEWTIFQTLVYIIAPFFLLLVLSDNDDEDGPPDGGIMSPVFEGTS